MGCVGEPVHRVSIHACGFGIGGVFGFERRASGCVFGDTAHEFDGRCPEPCGVAWRCGWLYVGWFECSGHEFGRVHCWCGDGGVGRFGEPFYHIERRRKFCGILLEQLGLGRVDGQPWWQ